MRNECEGAEKGTVLIVDDMPDNLALLSEVLKGEHRIKVANGGERALRIVLGDDPPDLVLLDIMMPGTDGYEVMRRMREDPRARDIPVIFITALTDMDSEIKGLELGAVDYITKPFNPLVVRRRVATHLALARARGTLARRNEELVEERRLVEDIVNRMRASKQFSDRHLRYIVEPVERSNGDILLATFTPDGRQWVLVGDFTGHGLSAAAAAPLVAREFYCHAAAGHGLVAAIDAINGIMCSQLPVQFFMVGIVVEVAADRSRFSLWNAGLPGCALFDADGGRKRRFDSDMIPFGIVADQGAATAHVECEFAPGDRLFMFSDGLTETENAQGELLGLDRAELMIATLEPAGPLDGLLDRLVEFHGNDLFHDDVTVVELLR